jgi:hypothetical protein
LTFSTFPAILALILGIERIPKLGGVGSIQRVARPFGLAVVALIVVVNLVTLASLCSHVTVPNLSPILDLQHADRMVPKGETIQVRDELDTSLLWITYFLRHRNLSLAHYSPYYLFKEWSFYQKAISANFVIVNKGLSLSED